MARFVVMYNGKAVKAYDLDDPVVTIGRLSENSITIPHMGVSRRHARIERNADGTLVVSDLNSLNGTLLNDNKITRAPVAIGDTIGVGKYAIQVKEDSADHDDTELPSAGTESELPETEGMETNSLTATSAITLSKSQAQPTSVLIETNRHIVYKIEKDVLTFGPLPDNDIFIPERLFGKDAILLTTDGTSVWIESRSLMTRLKVNGKKTRKQKLEHKDRIEIGKNTFRFMENS